MWQQRCKAHWLYDGDHNMKFFHASATTHKKQNTIRRIKDSWGKWTEDMEGIQQVLLEYFCGISTSSRLLHHDLEAMLSTVRPRVTESMNEVLLVPFTEEQVSLHIGIRQGDPLSPYLFLFEVEVFSSMLQEAEQSGDIKGIAVSRGAPRVSHLLFADDTIIFGQAREETMVLLKNILTVYGRASG
ncbi:UNVERIFIED_CONTAM: hypothetical protein Sradi_3980700 [Sesamum radiatum]|uniref:Reverse transcriptase domain-containing protein n=1 Tax=Sesamum radiatum TaxID=300843 RepID=A0AAW2PJU6_SESRA